MEVKGTTHLREALKNIYLRSGNYFITGPYLGGNNQHIYSNTLCSANIAGRTILPMMLESSEFLDSVDYVVNSDHRSGPVDRIVYPIIFLRNVIPTVVKKTADPLVGFLLGNRSRDRNSTIRSVRTKISGGDYYYGGSGYILDKDLTPLMILGVEYKIEGNTWKRENPVCVINPLVFQREDIVSKYIVKKVIPLLSDYDVEESLLTYTNKKMKVIISDEISRFMKSPVSPAHTTDKDLWDCIKENIEETYYV